MCSDLICLFITIIIIIVFPFFGFVFGCFFSADRYAGDSLCKCVWQIISNC